MLFLTKREKITFLTLIILVGLVIACGIGSKGADGKWFQNSNVATWFDSWGKGTEIVQTVDQNQDEEQAGTNITVADETNNNSGNAAETPAAGDQNADNSTENNGSVQNVETVEGETVDNDNGETTSEDVPV